jgi:hypothetical protein
VAAYFRWVGLSAYSPQTQKPQTQKAQGPQSSSECHAPQMGEPGSLAPDFYDLSVSIAIPNPVTFTLVGVSVHVDIDRYGQLFWGLGPAVGRTATLASGSLTANYMMQVETATPAEMSNFLTGHSVNATAGYWGGLSYTKSLSTGQSALGTGLVTPQIGGAWQYSWELGKGCK